MKRLLAILFLSVHLFNVCGYQLYFWWAENAADKHMVTALDKNEYNESDLLQIKFALNMPYASANKSYERLDGQVELNGIQYNYVKRMVKNDTLYLYCIPNSQKTKISNSRNEYAKQNADDLRGKKTDQLVLKKVDSKNEFNEHSLSFNFDVSNSFHSTTVFFNNTTIQKGFILKTIQPPDLFI